MLINSYILKKKNWSERPIASAISIFPLRDSSESKQMDIGGTIIQVPKYKITKGKGKGKTKAQVDQSSWEICDHFGSTLSSMTRGSDIILPIHHHVISLSSMNYINSSSSLAMALSSRHSPSPLLFCHQAFTFLHLLLQRWTGNNCNTRSPPWGSPCLIRFCPLRNIYKLLSFLHGVFCLYFFSL